MRISVIVPTYNKAPRLKLMLASVTAQTMAPGDFELILVDDGSCDMTEECVRSFSGRLDIRYIRSENRGRASARNIGIEHAEGDIIVFSDDDLIWQPDFLSKHLSCQEKGEAVIHGGIYNLSRVKFFEDPSEGTFFPSVSNNVDIEQMKKFCITSDDIINCFSDKIACNSAVTFLEKMIQSVFSQNISTLYWTGFTGGNLSCPAEWLRQANGFDEQFGRLWGFEDFELGYRLMQKGLPFLCRKDAANYHMAHYRTEYRDELRTTFEYFYQKHKDGCIADVYRFLNHDYSMEELLNKYREDGGCLC